MLTRQFLHLAENFGAPTRIATLTLTKFQFSSLCYWPVLRQHYSTTQLASPSLTSARVIRGSRSNAQKEASIDQIFGVPIFIFRGEQFWGNDRISMLARRLEQAGLSLSRAKQSA
jgi:hypothetical protein